MTVSCKTSAAYFYGTVQVPGLPLPPALTCQALHQRGLRIGNFGPEHSNISSEDHLRFWKLLKFSHHCKESRSVKLDSEGSRASAEKPKRGLGQEITPATWLTTQAGQGEVVWGWRGAQPSRVDSSLGNYPAGLGVFAFSRGPRPQQ